MSPERAVGGSFTNEQVTRLIDQAKEFATGRRLEARKLVEEFISSAAKGKASPRSLSFPRTSWRILSI
jgi:hypothetical protein